MKKVLEAYKRLIHHNEEQKSLDTYMTSKRYTLVDALNDYYTVKDSITPPTEKEICEILKEWSGDDWEFHEETKEEYAHFTVKGESRQMFLFNSYENTICNCGDEMPMNICKKLIQFFESLEEEQ